MNGVIALLGALGSFFFFAFFFSCPSSSLPLGFLFCTGFELLASFLDDFCGEKQLHITSWLQACWSTTTINLKIPLFHHHYH